MAHKGKRQYAGAEVANLSLGQGGWIYTVSTALDQFIAGVDLADADPLWYYPDVKFWSGVKVFPTTDADGNGTLVEFALTPYDTNHIDESKADTPGSVINIKLQAGQQLLGAFKNVTIVSSAEATVILFKG